MEYLIFLACPVGMGLMMWFMMRAGKSKSPERPAAPTRSPGTLDELRAEERRLAAELGRLESPEPR